jgi:hypothetical protein
MRDEHAFRILHVILSKPDEFFVLRESVVCFILASDVETISIPLNLQGNESVKKKLDLPSLLDVNLIFQ